MSEMSWHPTAHEYFKENPHPLVVPYSNSHGEVCRWLKQHHVGKYYLALGAHLVEFDNEQDALVFRLWAK
jgi:hypothetical protein